MPTPQNQPPIREYVSFSELAEDILGMSRARLYELVARGAMPQPSYCLRSRRPIFTREQQEQAVAVLRTGVGVDGSIVIRYRRRSGHGQSQQPSSTSARPRRRASAPQPSGHAELVSGLHALGVGQADERSVEAAIAECYPNGLIGQQESDVLRTLFRHFRRRQSA